MKPQTKHEQLVKTARCNHERWIFTGNFSGDDIAALLHGRFVSLTANCAHCGAGKTFSKQTNLLERE